MFQNNMALFAATFAVLAGGQAQAAINCIVPPTLTAPVSYVDKCPGDSDFPKEVKPGGKDVYIKLPASRTCTVPLTVTGARNVRITGGHFVQGDSSPATITIRNSSATAGTIFIDGLNIDVNGKYADAIRTYNYKGSLVLQNSNVRGISGTPNGYHGDIIHAQNGGPLTSLTMQNVTAITGYQGLFTPYRLSTGHGSRKVKLDRVQIAYDPKYTKRSLKLLYLGSADNAADLVPPDWSTFSSVYLDASFWNIAYHKSSYAEPVPASTCATYAAKHKVSGSVCSGRPASEFAPAANTGRSYSRSFFCTN